MHTTRRNLLKSMLVGAGGLGLRGVPASLVALAERAAAQTADPCDATALGASGRRQRLILITGASGDPLNANVPGTYGVSGLYHSTSAGFAENDHGTVTLGGTSYGCAAPWATLLSSAAIRDRTCFFHHGTYTVAHGDHAKVNAYMGAIRRGEMLCSFLAKHVHTCGPTATTQAPPVLLSNNQIRYTGAVLPVLDRGGLYTILHQPTAAQAAAIRALRAGDQRKLRDIVARSATPSQQAALATYLQAQDDARAADQTLIAGLNAPAGANEQQRDNTVAVTLLAMNLSPVVVMEYDFGGDNHSSMFNEVANTTQSVADLGDLFQKLTTAGLQDDVTIVLQYVFGRTLGAGARAGSPNGLNGRDHNAGHHCTVIIGKGFSGSVIGGVVPTPGGDFRADSINSISGAQGGDISYEQGLGSLGKTICAGMGLSRAVIEDQITIGKVVEAALAPELRTV